MQNEGTPDYSGVLFFVGPVEGSLQKTAKSYAKPVARVVAA